MIQMLRNLSCELVFTYLLYVVEMPQKAMLCSIQYLIFRKQSNRGQIDCGCFCIKRILKELRTRTHHEHVYM